MSRSEVFCGLAIAVGSEICSDPPAYRVEACTYDGKGVTLHLCSNHVHRARELAQAIMDKKHPHEELKVRSIHLHQIQKVSAAEAAS